MKNTIIHFYENLYHEDQPSRLFLGGITVAAISLDDARVLKKYFAKGEVWKAITDLGNEKAPSVDGFDIAYCEGGGYGFCC